MVTFPWHLGRWLLLSIKKKISFLKRSSGKMVGKRKNCRHHFGQHSESAFNWLAGMEKWCLYIIINILFLNNKLAVAFSVSLLMWPVAGQLQCKGRIHLQSSRTPEMAPSESFDMCELLLRCALSGSVFYTVLAAGFYNYGIVLGEVRSTGCYSLDFRI